MELTIDRVRSGRSEYIEGTIALPAHDIDLNIRFPGGQLAVLQWRVEGPTLDICFDQPVDVFNDGPDMQPAPVGPTNTRMGSHHCGVVQLVIPLRPEYAAEQPAEETSGMGQRTKDGGCQHCENETNIENGDEAKS